MRTLLFLASLSIASPALAEAPAPLAAQACGGCHGVGSRGAGDIVALAGRPKEEIVAAMAAFRSGERQGTIMGRIARGYSEAEIAAIAASLSASR
ncbi:MAG: sulfide dehydrogenase [Acetobacteraceae bacterium]|jgi:cytochrome c553|nr:sulfide dehydrogenase [Acetobacteraceae bacterium]